MMEYIDSFFVKEQKSGTVLTCCVRILEQGDYHQVAALQKQVVDGLANKELYSPLTPEELENILGGEGGLALGAFVQDGLIGFRCLYFPGYSDDNLGRDIGLPPAALPQVAHLEASFVHPDFRGNSLQKRLTELILCKLRDSRDCRYLLATVMPENIPSILDKFAQNMAIVELKEKYQKGWRYIFCRDLQDIADYITDQAVYLDNKDIAGQKALLQEGYRGIACKNTPSGTAILYARCY